MYGRLGMVVTARILSKVCTISKGYKGRGTRTTSPDTILSVASGFMLTGSPIVFCQPKISIFGEFLFVIT